MSEEIDIAKQMVQEQLKNQKQKVVNKSVDTQTDSLESMDFWSACQNFLHDKTDLVCITNHAASPKSKSVYYIFKIERQQLTLTNFKQKSKSTFVYNHTNTSLTLNNQPQPEEALPDFVKQLNTIGKDLRDQKAFIFEVPRKEGG